MAFSDLNNHQKRYSLIRSKSASRADFERKRNFYLLRDWYGDERARTEISAYTANPVNAGDVIASLCENLADADAAVFIELGNHWKEIVGTPFANFTNPARFYKGTLYLEVKHALMIRELTPSLDLFLNRINETLGKDTCREIRLVPPGGVSRSR